MGFLLLAELFVQPLEEDVEDRNHKNPQYRSHQKTSYRAGTDGAITLGADACGKHQGKQSNDEGKRRHQNRSEPDSRTFEGGVDDSVPCPSSLNGEFNDEDSVFRQQTD